MLIFIQIDSSSDEEDEDEEPTSITEKIKERFAKSIEAAKHLGEKVLTNVKDKVCRYISSSKKFLCLNFLVISVCEYR
jgi:hypothetical protein